MSQLLLDMIYKRMGDPMEAPVEKKGDSEVAKFYAGLSVFVTGGTDLIGKCLLEKLLRSCPELKKLYVLVRTKKGEDFQNKCNKLYNDPAFDALRELDSEFARKIAPVRGDLTLDKLGLSGEDYARLCGEVDVIVHNGSATGLNEQVSLALRTNVLGTKRMLELAKQCGRLKAFLLVSTAYSHCHERVLEEQFYRAPADLKTVDDMLEADAAPSGLTDDSLKMLLGDWPNIYTFTKATAEDLVQRDAARANFACCVFRPSTVISSYKEPKPGYCDSKNGPAAFFTKIAKGAIHVVYKVDYPCDLIPADLAVNAILVCARDAVDRWQVEPEASVYNLGTSTEQPLFMHQIKDKMLVDPKAFELTKRRRLPYVMFADNLFCYFVLRIIFDYIPAMIVDVLLVLHGYEPEAWSLLRESMGDMCRLMRFSQGNWRVRSSETLKVCDRLNARDRELFFCDVRKLDWGEYFMTFWRGIRLYSLGEVYAPEPEEQQQASRCPCRCRCKCRCKCPVVKGLFLLILATLAYYSVVLFRGVFF